MDHWWAGVDKRRRKKTCKYIKTRREITKPLHARLRSDRKRKGSEWVMENWWGGVSKGEKKEKERVVWRVAGREGREGEERATE